MTSSQPLSFDERALGMMVGLAIGDALFAPVEFMSPERIQAKYDGPLTEMVGGGWLSVRPGQHTDDTEMALCLSRALVTDQAYDPLTVADNYQKWYASGPLDIGNTVSGALNLMKRGMTPHQAAEAYHQRSGGMSGGNGTIMRIAPLALAYGRDPQELAQLARREASLTHYEPLGLDACMLFCDHLASLLYGEGEWSQRQQEVDAAAWEAYQATPQEAEQRVNTAPGFVLTALAVAAASLQVAEQAPDGQTPFEAGLVWAGNLGGDADTDGAVAGALLGATYGLGSIPQRWLQHLEARDELEQLTEQLAAIAA